MSALRKWLTDQLARLPSAAGIPLLVLVAVLIWLGVMKLLGL